MTFKISFQNEGGELESRTAETAAGAVQVAIDMMLAAGELFGGDKIVISELADA